MPPAPDDDRRRLIPIESTAGSGEMAALEFGPDNRAIDILLLHANGFNARTYRQALAPLGAALRVLAVDLRGHGLSRLPTPTTHHAWKVYADDLLALLRALGAPPRVLAGHSMGATACLLAAPHLTDAGNIALVLFDPVVAGEAVYADSTGALAWDQPLTQAALRRKATFASRTEAATAYRGRGAFKTWPDAVLQDYLADGLRETPDGSVTLACAPAWEAANFAAYAISNPYAGFAAAAGRLRVLRAETGSTCSVTEQSATTRWPGIRMETVAGTTHFLPMERPDVVQAALRDAVR